MELFCDRVTNLMPGFSPSAVQLAQVAELCGHLDGVPLAIELAAARVPSLGVDAIVRRLDERFSLLGTRSTGDRTQGLEEMVLWSHDLLLPHEQAVLRGLSVFPSDFDIDAAVAVVADDELTASVVVAALADLVDRSMVAGGNGRYWLLETVRLFAHTRLVAHGDDAATRVRHASHILSGLARDAASDREWLARTRALVADLRSALTFALEHDEELATELARRAAPYVRLRGPLEEGADWLLRVVEIAADGDRHQLLVEAADLLRRCGRRGDARTALLRARSGARSAVEEIDAFARLAQVSTDGMEVARARTELEAASALLDEHAVEGARHGLDIDLDLTAANICYLERDVASQRRLLTSLRDDIGRRGTPAQRERLEGMSFGFSMAEARYEPSDAFLEATARRVEQVDPDDPMEVVGAHFSAGFARLAGGQPAVALEHLDEAASTIEALGLETRLAQIDAYRCLALRRLRRVVELRPLVVRHHDLCSAHGPGVYVAVAEANRAWLAWRDGDLEEAASWSTQAVERWARDSARYPFRWVGVLPLLAARHASAHEHDHRQLATGLLDSSQQLPPPALGAALERVAEAHDGDLDEALDDVVRTAMAIGWL